MSVIGVPLEQSVLVLTKGRDFRCTFKSQDGAGVTTNFPSGSLFFEIATSPTPLTWTFSITGSTATLKIESTVVDTIPDRTKWQLVFMPTGEAAGGDPIAIGTVKVQA